MCAGYAIESHFGKEIKVVGSKEVDRTIANLRKCIVEGQGFKKRGWSTFEKVYKEHQEEFKKLSASDLDYVLGQMAQVIKIWGSGKAGTGTVANIFENYFDKNKDDALTNIWSYVLGTKIAGTRRTIKETSREYLLGLEYKRDYYTKRVARKREAPQIIPKPIVRETRVIIEEQTKKVGGKTTQEQALEMMNGTHSLAEIAMKTGLPIEEIMRIEEDSAFKRASPQGSAKTGRRFDDFNGVNMAEVFVTIGLKEDGLDVSRSGLKRYWQDYGRWAKEKPDLAFQDQKVVNGLHNSYFINYVKLRENGQSDPNYKDVVSML
ncbi:hypothetical protein KJ780_04450 [Candidatus Micrarchaeota archaeon]|nr:hypothetical protein [Candidatus Micrarchaeota archaeon]